MSTAHELLWKIDECSSYFGRLRLRGWCFSRREAVTALFAKFRDSESLVPLPGYGQASPDVAAAVCPTAHHVRFDDWITPPEQYRGSDFVLAIRFADGSWSESPPVLVNARDGDPAHGCWSSFIEALKDLPPGEILELGSRARSALTVHNLIPPCHRYVGLDILPGPNVDVVGDAHDLSAVFAAGRFAAIFSRSVFEHLAMPWKVVLELNRVLRPGGLVFVATHQSWVLHEEPWDFWRYSRHTWPCLFNAATGFEIVASAHGEPVRLHAMWNSTIVHDMASHPAFLSSAVIARKVAETSLSWPVSTAQVTAGTYPAGELQQFPT